MGTTLNIAWKEKWPEVVMYMDSWAQVNISDMSKKNMFGTQVIYRYVTWHFPALHNDKWTSSVVMACKEHGDQGLVFSSKHPLNNLPQEKTSYSAGGAYPDGTNLLHKAHGSTWHMGKLQSMLWYTTGILLQE